MTVYQIQRHDPLFQRLLDKPGTADTLLLWLDTSVSACKAGLSSPSVVPFTLARFPT
ncbi:hypothetical protein WCLP8_4430002 [uncultured Gammaproteobacteria bacterium]